MQKAYEIAERNAPQEKEVGMSHVWESTVYSVEQEKRSLLTNLRM